MNARRAGFTLIELLIVVALISIMLVIAVPSFTAFISSNRVTSAVNDFLQGVTLTRNEAIKRGRRVMMMPNTSAGIPSVAGDWKYGWTIFVDAEVGAGNLIFKHEVLAESIALRDSGGSANMPFTDSASKTYISFDGTGYPRELGGAGLTAGMHGIVVTDTTGSSINVRTLCLANLGRPRVVKGLDPNNCAGG